MDNQTAYSPTPGFTLQPFSLEAPRPPNFEGVERTAGAIRQWAADLLEGVRTAADLQEVLKKILIEVRRNREEKVRGTKPRWLKVDQARRYLGGMSETWIRDLEKVAPRGLFRRLRGTEFIDRLMLDRIMEGIIELDEL